MLVVVRHVVVGYLLNDLALDIYEVVEIGQGQYDLTILFGELSEVLVYTLGKVLVGFAVLNFLSYREIKYIVQELLNVAFDLLFFILMLSNL